MPKDNIERAIAKGTGDGADADAIETVLYEGYGPGGVALLIEAVHRQPQPHRRRRAPPALQARRQTSASRAASPTCSRSAASSSSTRRATARTTCWSAIDAGAEDIELDDDVLEIVTAPAISPPSGERWRPPASKSRMPSWRSARVFACALDETQATRLIRLIEALEENDDVAAVHANFDVAADVLERVAG